MSVYWESPKDTIERLEGERDLAIDIIKEIQKIMVDDTNPGELKLGEIAAVLDAKYE